MRWLRRVPTIEAPVAGVTAHVSGDGIDRSDPEDGDTWKVCHIEVHRDGKPLFTVQITNIDAAVFVESPDPWFEVGVVDRRPKEAHT